MKASEGYGHSFHDCYVELTSRNTCKSVRSYRMKCLGFMKGNHRLM
jgi:hypothetical protein